VSNLYPNSSGSALRLLSPKTPAVTESRFERLEGVEALGINCVVQRKNKNSLTLAVFGLLNPPVRPPIFEESTLID
jgi:hypothetical protein